jgi:hypothetical protein
VWLHNDAWRTLPQLARIIEKCMQAAAGSPATGKAVPAGAAIISFAEQLKQVHQSTGMAQAEWSASVF